MAKLTKAQCEQLVDEYLELQPHVERAKDIEKDLKANLGRFANGVRTEYGRAFVSVSERIEVPVEVANQVLGLEMGAKIMVVKRSVANKLLDAFHEAGEIGEREYARLMELAKRKPITSLYVRPLK